jgi:apolipoprotein N-acyltransferase
MFIIQHLIYVIKEECRTPYMWSDHLVPSTAHWSLMPPAIIPTSVLSIADLDNHTGWAQKVSPVRHLLFIFIFYFLFFIFYFGIHIYWLFDFIINSLEKKACIWSVEKNTIY